MGRNWYQEKITAMIYRTKKIRAKSLYLLGGRLIISIISKT
jgi:hypothetical protein